MKKKSEKRKITSAMLKMLFVRIILTTSFIWSTIMLIHYTIVTNSVVLGTIAIILNGIAYGIGRIAILKLYNSAIDFTLTPSDDEITEEEIFNLILQHWDKIMQGGD